MSKNLNIRISEELDEKIKVLRERHCINISQFIKQCLIEKYEEMANGKKEV